MKWSEQGLRWLLRYGRKHDGVWNDALAEDESLPNEMDAINIVKLPEIIKENEELRNIGKSLLFLIDECLPNDIFNNGVSAFGVDEGDTQTSKILCKYRKILNKEC